MTDPQRNEAPLGERKEKILTALTEAYIRTGEPVGSKWLVERLDHAVSSATIRNEMAELDAMGYLEQPHTSAGRIPTAKAFRLYVDKLMQPRPLSAETRGEIDEELSRAADPDELMHDASQVLVRETGCAAVTTTPVEPSAVLRRVEILLMSARSAAIVLMTGSGVLRSRVCRLMAPVSPETLRTLSQMLTRTFVGRELTEIGLPRVQSLLTSLGEEGLLCVPVLTAFYELAQAAAASEVLLDGQLNLLRNPDFAPERVHSLLGFLSEQSQLSHLLALHSGGLRVMFGSEGRRPELIGSSLIVTRYTPPGSDGVMGLIGPQRMDYAAAIPTLTYVADTVQRLFEQFTKE
ncbi:MAG: heat-inducible transcription repressor HrcA [Clostridia bacterium]|nr:heat-inducible transcription repressor HrcA [Clostridia bacterium]